MASLGDIQNKPFLTDRQVNKVAAGVNLTAGMVVYQDGANGLKPVPVSGIPAPRCRFLEKPANNTSGALGAISAETFKKGAITVCKCDGAITVGGRVRASTVTSGRVAQVDDPPAAPATYGQTEAEKLRAYVLYGLGTYLGKPLQGKEIGNEPTDAADGDDVVIAWD